MLFFGLDAGFESLPPLVNGLIHNRLLLLLPWKPCSWYSAHTKLMMSFLRMSILMTLNDLDQIRGFTEFFLRFWAVTHFKS